MPLTVPALFETTIDSLPLEMLMVLDDSEVVMAARTALAHRARPNKVVNGPMLVSAVEVDIFLTTLKIGCKPRANAPWIYAAFEIQMCEGVRGRGSY